MVIIWRAARALSSCYARSKRVRATSCLLYTTLFCIYVRDCFHSLNLRPPFTINLKVIHFFKKLEKIIPWKWTSAVTLFISSACNFVCLCYYLVLVNYIPSSSGGNNRVIFFFTHLRTSVNFLLIFWPPPLITTACGSGILSCMYC